MLPSYFVIQLRLELRTLPQSGMLYLPVCFLLHCDSAEARTQDPSAKRNALPPCAGNYFFDIKPGFSGFNILLPALCFFFGVEFFGMHYFPGNSGISEFAFLSVVLTQSSLHIVCVPDIIFVRRFAI